MKVYVFCIRQPADTQVVSVSTTLERAKTSAHTILAARGLHSLEWTPDADGGEWRIRVPQKDVELTIGEYELDGASSAILW